MSDFSKKQSIKSTALKYGIVLDKVFEVGRMGFLLSPAQDDDLLLLYRHDIGIQFNPLKFIETFEEVKSLIEILTEEKLLIK